MYGSHVVHGPLQVVKRKTIVHATVQGPRTEASCDQLQWMSVSYIGSIVHGSWT